MNSLSLACLISFLPFKEKIKSIVLAVVEIEGRRIAVLIGQFISGKKFIIDPALLKGAADEPVQIDLFDSFLTADIFKFVLIEVARKDFIITFGGTFLGGTQSGYWYFVLYYY